MENRALLDSSKLDRNYDQVMRNVDFLKKHIDERKREDQSQKKKGNKKLKFTLKNDFPVLDGFVPPPKKQKIKKKKKKTGKMIKRFDCELINVSEKVEEVCQKKRLGVFETSVAPKTEKRKKKLSRIKKTMEAMRDIAETQNKQADFETFDKFNKDKGNMDDYKEYVRNQSSLQSKLRKKINNKEEVKKGHNNDIEIREYVDNVQSTDFDCKILKFLNSLSFSQMLKKKTNPLKLKKRFVSGFNEVIKTLCYMKKQK